MKVVLYQKLFHIACLNKWSSLYRSVILTAAKKLVFKDFYAVITVMLTKQ